MYYNLLQNITFMGTQTLKQ